MDLPPAGRAEDLPPYNDHLGFRTVSVEAGRVLLEADVGPHLHNPMATLHGGVLSGLADSAMGQTAFSVLAPEDGCTNLDLHMRFLRPFVAGRLHAEGRIAKQGRRVLAMEATVTDGEGTVLAEATSSFLVLQGARSPAAV